MERPALTGSAAFGRTHEHALLGMVSHQPPHKLSLWLSCSATVTEKGYGITYSQTFSHKKLEA